MMSYFHISSYFQFQKNLFALFLIDCRLFFSVASISVLSLNVMSLHAFASSLTILGCSPAYRKTIVNMARKIVKKLAFCQLRDNVRIAPFSRWLCTWGRPTAATAPEQQQPRGLEQQQQQQIRFRWNLWCWRRWYLVLLLCTVDATTDKSYSILFYRCSCSMATLARAENIRFTVVQEIFVRASGSRKMAWIHTYRSNWFVTLYLTAYAVE